jgi:hypothetical protein
MLEGRRVKLQSPTLAIGEDESGKRIAVTIPGGSLLKIVSEPHNGNRMVDVLLDGRALVMFAADLRQRGVEISEESAH